LLVVPPTNTAGPRTPVAVSVAEFELLLLKRFVRKFCSDVSGEEEGEVDVPDVEVLSVEVAEVVSFTNWRL
jgi:hypothetical protein